MFWSSQGNIEQKDDIQLALNRLISLDSSVPPPWFPDLNTLYPKWHNRQKRCSYGITSSGMSSFLNPLPLSQMHPEGSYVFLSQW